MKTIICRSVYKLYPVLCDLMVTGTGTRLPCPSLSPGVCLHSCPLSQWYDLTISSSAHCLKTIINNIKLLRGQPEYCGLASPGAHSELLWFVFRKLSAGCYEEAKKVEFEQREKLDWDTVATATQFQSMSKNLEAEMFLQRCLNLKSPNFTAKVSHSGRGYRYF